MGKYGKDGKRWEKMDQQSTTSSRDMPRHDMGNPGGREDILGGQSKENVPLRLSRRSTKTEADKWRNKWRKWRRIGEENRRTEKKIGEENPKVT